MQRRLKRLANGPLASARAAGLRYTHDDRPGRRRVKAGRAFRYLDTRGKPVRGSDLKRIRAPGES
jgi:DNA topoisomerase-1